MQEFKNRPASTKLESLHNKARVRLEKAGILRPRDLGPVEDAIQGQVKIAGTAPDAFREKLEANLRVAAENQRSQVTFDYKAVAKHKLARGLVLGGLSVILVFVLIRLFEQDKTKE